jgi:hypothetical protein
MGEHFSPQASPLADPNKTIMIGPDHDRGS